MIGKPGGNCRHFTVWQQRHDPPPFKITDDRSIAMIAAKGQSSMPAMTVAVCKWARRRTTRSNVSLLTGTISRLAKPAAGRPPSAGKWMNRHSSGHSSSPIGSFTFGWSSNYSHL
jgi:hypothetical protein